MPVEFSAPCRDARHHECTPLSMYAYLDCDCGCHDEGWEVS